MHFGFLADCYKVSESYEQGYQSAVHNIMISAVIIRKLFWAAIENWKVGLSMTLSVTDQFKRKFTKKQP